MGALGLPLLALLFGARAGAPTLCEDCKYLSLELEAVLASSARSAEVLDSGRCPLQRLASAIGTPGLLRGRRIWPRRWRVSCEVMLECYEEPLEDWYFQHQKRLLRKFLCEGHVPGARDVACLDEVWTRSKGDHGNQEEEEDTDTARSMTPASSEKTQTIVASHTDTYDPVTLDLQRPCPLSPFYSSLLDDSPAVTSAGLAPMNPPRDPL
ncbi:canopy-like protein 4 isoform A [Alligator mississippiensis]|uniref:Canopy-like protein 4 isoform A n=1 Tax=Alligator mississippiensis TaxID=8496 RepID=A0A151MCL7_ALLMI|nr:canopy-like protein 4 isoform A [Alligator mississippiensis]